MSPILAIAVLISRNVMTLPTHVELYRGPLVSWPSWACHPRGQPALGPERKRLWEICFVVLYSASARPELGTSGYDVAINNEELTWTNLSRRQHIKNMLCVFGNGHNVLESLSSPVGIYKQSKVARKTQHSKLRLPPVLRTSTTMR